MKLPSLEKRNSQDAGTENIESGWRLTIRAGQARAYRLAQLDNYGTKSRGSLPHRPPLTFSLDARSSHVDSPGTWGFGLWNDPFGLSLGFGANGFRLPALPNAAWFFFAAPENYLALKEGSPANGSMAALYRSPHIPALLLAFNLPLLPLLAWKPGSRWLRWRAAQLIRQDGAALDINPTAWHHYEIHWKQDSVNFSVDGKSILNSTLSPLLPLGLVIWIDNQYAAWRPDGQIAYGTLPTRADCWVEIKDLHFD